jgi:RimJ/RimL family protein N-acetyltransferase
MFLKTSRTYIRPFIQEDLDELSQLCTCAEAMHFIPPHFSPETREQVDTRLQKYLDHYEEHGISIGHVANNEGKFMGRAGFYFIPEVNQYEIAYSLLPEYWGQGLATEICSALLDYAYNTLNLDKVCARVTPGHTASENVLAKTGFIAMGERIFPVADKYFIFNYFERENDDLELHDAHHSDEWDFLV